MSDEKCSGVIFWWNPGLRKGVLCDLNGTTYVFRNAATPHDDYIRGPVFPDDWQLATEPGKLRDGSDASWLVTEPTIVEFGMEFFTFREDRAEGSLMFSVAPAENYSQRDYESLITIREKYDAQKLAERKARYEAAHPREGNNRQRMMRHASRQNRKPRRTASRF